MINSVVICFVLFPQVSNYEATYAQNRLDNGSADEGNIDGTIQDLYSSMEISASTEGCALNEMFLDCLYCY